MWEEYGVYRGLELWNNNRYLSYIRSGFGDGSIQADVPGVTMPLVVDVPSNWSYDSPVYDSPVDDLAPWYDPLYPESGRSAGMYVTNIEGFSVGGARSVSQGVSGGVAESYRLRPKTLTVTGWLSGRDCGATQYLYRWLSGVLRGDVCRFSDSFVEDFGLGLGMYDCCGGESEQEALDFFRVMGKVKVVSDPEVIERLGVCCDDCGFTNIKIQFTLLLENPRIYDPNPNLCLDETTFYDEENIEVSSISINDGDGCLDDCEQEGTVVVERSYSKRRFGVKILADRSWCPVGGWLPHEYFDAPERGYLDPVVVEQQRIPVNIYIRENGTFATYPYERVHFDLREVDFCKIDFQIVQARRTAEPGGTYGTLQGDTFTDVFDGEDRVLKIRLHPTSSLEGIWEPRGWNIDQFQNVVLPFPGIKLEIDNDCGCSQGGEDCELILHENGSWSPAFDYVGSFPPIGCRNVVLQNQYPGKYTILEEVPVSEAFGGVSRIKLDSYSHVESGYCQPLEWFEKCCEFDFVSGVENAQPVWVFGSGSESLHNFRVDLYKKKSVEECYCSFDRSCNRTPDYSFRVGPMIPSDTVLKFDVFEGRFVAQIIDPLTSETKTFDASGLVSGRNGGSPGGVEFSSCLGVCVVVTAEVRRDPNGDIVSPAPDANVSLGYYKYSVVGV